MFFSYRFSYSCEMPHTVSTPGVLNECDKCQMNITQIYDKKHWHEYCELLQFSSNLLKILQAFKPNCVTGFLSMHIFPFDFTGL